MKVISYPKAANMPKLDLLRTTIWEIMVGSLNNPPPLPWVNLLIAWSSEAVNTVVWVHIPS